VRQKLAYGATGAVVWGGSVFIIARYVLSLHSLAQTIGVSVLGAVLGGISSYRGERE
jgi:hypothetical protein